MSLPSRPPASTSMIVQMAFINPPRSLANRRQSPRLAMFHGRSADPANPGIPTNCTYLLTRSPLRSPTVLRIHEYNFVVFVGSILIDPIWVENSQIGASSPNTFFRSRPQWPLVFELVYSLICLPSQFQLNWIRTGLPYVAPLGTGRLRPPLRTRIR